MSVLARLELGLATVALGLLMGFLWIWLDALASGRALAYWRQTGKERKA